VSSDEFLGERLAVFWPLGARGAIAVRTNSRAPDAAQRAALCGV